MPIYNLTSRIVYIQLNILTYCFVPMNNTSNFCKIEYIVKINFVKKIFIPHSRVD